MTDDLIFAAKNTGFQWWNGFQCWGFPDPLKQRLPEMECPPLIPDVGGWKVSRASWTTGQP